MDRFQSRDLILISRHIGTHHLPVNIWPEVVFMIKNGFMRDFLAVGADVVGIKELIWQEYLQSLLVD